MSEEFKREDRYIVIKRSELSCLSAPELVELEIILGQIRMAHAKAKKPPLQCAVVESDWSIYEQVWKLIELEAQGAKQQPADEDAWLVEAKRLIDGAVVFSDEMGNSSHRKKLIEHLRTHPQQAGFVSVPVEPATDTKRLNFMQDNLLRDASMRFDDGSFKAVNAWTIASAGKDLRAAVDAMIAAATKGDGK